MGLSSSSLTILMCSLVRPGQIIIIPRSWLKFGKWSLRVGLLFLNCALLERESFLAEFPH